MYRRSSSAILRLLTLPLIGSLALAQTSSPGKVAYFGYVQGSLLNYALSPASLIQQWFRNHFAGMIAFPPYFDSNVSWFPNTYAYFDLYGIQKGSWEESVHPEWILHDQSGNKLYLPYACSGGTCAQYAADIANPAFRKAWINNAAGTAYAAHYAGVFIDDVNLNFQVSDGNGNPVAPIDSNSGAPMTWQAWRNYMATYLEEARGAMGGLKIIENVIWYAGPDGVQDSDAAIKRQIATADIINLERGVASDSGLTGGTGQFSVYALLNFIDRVHAAGKGVNYQEYDLDPAGQQYGLASYFLISNGKDSINDGTTTPDNWFAGYSVDLGTPLGARTYSNGVFSRDFTGGKVLLGEPGLGSRTVDLGGSFTTLNGTPVTSVTISSRQGIVLQTGTPQLGVLNAASQAAGPVSPGEVVSLPGTFTGRPQVLVNGVAAAILSVASDHVNVIVPFGLDLSGPAKFEVQGSTVSAPVVAAAPAIFTSDGSGTGQGAILNQDYSVNSGLNPAAAGTAIMVYATGLGTVPSLLDGIVPKLAASTSSSVTATIGGVPAQVLYSGTAPGLIAGIFQVNILVPSGVTVGSAVPVVLQIGDYKSQASVTVGIQ